jgi:hypothetical protein
MDAFARRGFDLILKMQMRSFEMLSRTIAIALTLAAAGFDFVPDASAEVRIGKNVRIGGHDVSNQTFNKKRRAEYYIYNYKPKNEGCRWRKNRDGSRTKVCHLQRK